MSVSSQKCFQQVILLRKTKGQMRALLKTSIRSDHLAISSRGGGCIKFDFGGLSGPHSLNNSLIRYGLIPDCPGDTAPRVREEEGIHQQGKAQPSDLRGNLAARLGSEYSGLALAGTRRTGCW